MTTRIFCSFALISALGGHLLLAQDITTKDLLAGLANPARWLTYSGDYSGRHQSPLTEITPANASRLLPQWTMQTGVLGKFEATPIVIDGNYLFQYRVGSPVYASPTTYAIDGRQYVVLPAGTTLTAFAVTKGPCER